MECAEEKRRLRQVIRARLRALEPGEFLEAGRKIVEHVTPLLDQISGLSQDPPTVAYFASLPHEISTEPLDELLRTRRVRRLLPRISAGELVFHQMKGGEPVSALERDRLGIHTPTSALPVVPLEDADLILAPGLAFDSHGARLGQGGGYYDRMLQKVRASASPPSVIGICLDIQRLEQIPTEPLDERVDAVCSPRQGLTRARSLGVDPPTM